MDCDFSDLAEILEGSYEGHVSSYEEVQLDENEGQGSSYEDIQLDEKDLAELYEIIDKEEQSQNVQMTSEKFTYDEIGCQPKYVATTVFRGDTIDTFFNKPLYKHMVSNEVVMSTINYGSNEEVIGLPNFLCQTPGTKAKCDQALECKFFTDVTLYLLYKYNLKQIADVYKRIALLSDRICLGCKSTSPKVVCFCGKWRCHNCVKKGMDISFGDGLEEWLKNGSPTRHAQVHFPAS
jgi:hypothetical protein